MKIFINIRTNNLLNQLLESISQRKPLTPMNLLFNFLIRITGKNDRQTSAIKTKVRRIYLDKQHSPLYLKHNI